MFFKSIPNGSKFDLIEKLRGRAFNVFGIDLKNQFKDNYNESYFEIDNHERKDAPFLSYSNLTNLIKIDKPDLSIYLTRHQDISGKANKAELATVATTGSYNDLTDKPSIPSINGLASKSWVEGKGYLTEHQSLENYATKSEIPSTDGLASESFVIGKIDEVNEKLKWTTI